MIKLPSFRSNHRKNALLISASVNERQDVLEVVNSQRFCDQAPGGIYGTLLEAELIAAGVNECIQKPYMTPDVLQRIAHHLSSADSSAEPIIH
jgi:hypothetical protein